MASSNTSGASPPAPASSLPNGLPSSTPPSNPNPEEEGLDQNLGATWLKVRMADHLRRMADNQRILNTSTEEDRALRQQRHRFREAQLQKMVPQCQPLEFPKDDDMQINVDSPKVIHHHHPPPPSPPEQAKPVPGLLSKALPWLLAGALGLGGVAAGYFLPRVGVSTSTTNREGFLIELVEPPKK